MSKIEWTEKTWNPITGCTKVSPGCDNCYAEKMAKRLKGMGQKKYENCFDLTLHPNCLEEPLKRKKPTTYFVCSMGDLFHEDVPFDFIDQVMAVTALCPQHTFIFLTKRVKLMAEYWSDKKRRLKIINTNIFYWKSKDGDSVELPLSNVYNGATFCNQIEYDQNITDLLKVPGEKFISLEPMLDQIALRLNKWVCSSCLDWTEDVYLTEENYCECDVYEEERYKNVIDQVILGGESGPNARPMNPDWVRGVRDQCEDAGVPFMFKQFGEWVAEDHPEWEPKAGQDDSFVNILKNSDGIPIDYTGQYMARITKKKAGRTLDGKIHSELIWNK